MLTLVFAAGLVLAPAAAAQLPADTVPAAAPAPAPSETDLSLRRGRLAAYIRAGWHAGWLDRQAMNEAFAKLRANRREEDDMRAASGNGRLTEAQRMKLGQGLDDLSQSMRYARARKNSEPRRMR